MENFYLIYSNDCPTCKRLRKKFNDLNIKIKIIQFEEIMYNPRFYEIFNYPIVIPMLFNKVDNKFINTEFEKYLK